jgi:lysyl-tRNA synthetase class 2
MVGSRNIRFLQGLEGRGPGVRILPLPAGSGGVQPQFSEYRAQRLANMAKLRELGYAPFGAAYARTGRLAELKANFEENKPVRAAGRITARREMGKSVFMDLRDGTDRMQVYLKRDDLGPAFEAFAYVDLGDHVGVEGELFTTRTGEKSIKMKGWVLLSKALLPPPEKWHGLSDVEMRYRQRYLDLIANPEVREVFNQRIAIVRGPSANFLVSRGFQEVETPMMQAMAGGAAATPFKTHYDALNCDMFLRIAPELYLKRLLVGGFDKVFELNRNFRNEGLSRFHNPEFTMMEIYEAYGDLPVHAGPGAGPGLPRGPEGDGQAAGRHRGAAHRPDPAVAGGAVPRPGARGGGRRLV